MHAKMVRSTQIARIDGRCSRFPKHDERKMKDVADVRWTGLMLAASVDDEQVGLRASDQFVAAFTDE